MASPLSNIVLPKPYVMIQPEESYLGIESNDGAYGFGTVAAVYATSDKTYVGDSVMYLVAGSQTISYSGITIVMVIEDNVQGTEFVFK